MNYFVIREEQQFGPYSLADLQRYLAQGNVLPTDLARSEAMEEPRSVQEIVGNISIHPQPSPQSYGQLPGYAVPQQAQQPGMPAAPLPPGLHWAVVLLLTVCTCGLFSVVWAFVQATYVKKIQSANNSIIYYAIGFPILLGGSLLSGLVGNVASNAQVLATLLRLGGAVVVLVGHFSLKGALEEYFTSVEPLNLQLSGVMTFFFNTIYFQYHLSRIRNWKLTGVYA